MENLHQKHALEESSEFISSAKVDRLETILDEKVGELVTLVNQMKNHTKALSLEAEELKAIRGQFKTDMMQTLQVGIKATIAPLADQVALRFSDKVKSFVDEQFDCLHKLSDTALQTIRGFSGLTWKFLGFSTFASMLSGVMCFLICYFLMPLKPVPQEFTEKQKNFLVYGKLLADNFEKLDKKDQELLSKEFAKLRLPQQQ